MWMYSDETRENAEHALPDVEVFHSSDYPAEADAEPLEPGWYYWYCLPGCLPDSEPFGPFESAESAIEAMREENEI